MLCIMKSNIRRNRLRYLLKITLILRFHITQVEFQEWFDYDTISKMALSQVDYKALNLIKN